MPNLKSIKNRIRSVKSTGKITQAMKMVAASKVKKAENAAKESRPYSMFLDKIFDELAKSKVDTEFKTGKFKSALENYPALLEIRPVKNVGLLILTSDKGLAGAYNANVIKETLSTIKEYNNNAIGVKVFIVGLKGIAGLKHLIENSTMNQIKKNYSKIPELVEVEVANMIAEDLAQAYISNEIDEIDVIYTEFKTMLSYKVSKYTLLPLKLPEKNNSVAPEMIFMPSKEEILQKLVPLYISNSVYRALKESIASELAARMNAMGNATKNAEEIVKALSVTYNKIRQYSITQEITEVVSGANAVQ